MLYRKEELLNSAWYITYKSVIYKVANENKELNDEKLKEAEYKIRFIDKNDWFTIARKIVSKNTFIKKILLAQMASTKFINDDTNQIYKGNFRRILTNPYLLV